MKALPLLQLLIVSTCVMSEEEQGIDRHPDEEFTEALGKLEEAYINGMRALAEKSVSVRIFQIDPKRLPLETDPFAATTYSEDRFLFFEDAVYQIRKASDSVGERENVMAWAHAIFPTENHAVAMCMPTPGFAVKFLDGKGSTIYQTTICLKCSFVEIRFPLYHYSNRIGIDVALIGNLLEDQGFDPKEGEPEQALPLLPDATLEGFAPKEGESEPTAPSGGDQPSD